RAFDPPRRAPRPPRLPSPPLFRPPARGPDLDERPSRDERDRHLHDRLVEPRRGDDLRPPAIERLELRPLDDAREREPDELRRDRRERAHPPTPPTSQPGRPDPLHH